MDQHDECFIKLDRFIAQLRRNVEQQDAGRQRMALIDPVGQG
jgi:hypothetical protein